MTGATMSASCEPSILKTGDFILSGVIGRVNRSHSHIADLSGTLGLALVCEIWLTAAMFQLAL